MVAYILVSSLVVWLFFLYAYPRVFSYLPTCNLSTRLLVNSFTCQLVYSSTRLLVNSFTRQLVYSSTRLLVNSFTRQLVYLSTCLLVNPFTCQLVYLFTQYKLYVVFSTRNSVRRLIWLAVSCCSGVSPRMKSSVSMSPSLRKGYFFAWKASTVTGCSSP